MILKGTHNKGIGLYFFGSAGSFFGFGMATTAALLQIFVSL